jgi:hypothetical protein
MRRRRKYRSTPQTGTLKWVATGAVAGAALGILAARRFRSVYALAREVRRWLSGAQQFLVAEDEIVERLHRRPTRSLAETDEWEDEDEIDEDAGATLEDESEASDELVDEDAATPTGAVSTRAQRREERRLAMRVLAAFEEDGVLSARAVDITPAPDGVIELTGRVRTADEAARAAAVARRVDGVTMVVNRIRIRDAGNVATASVQRDPERRRSDR